MIANFIKYMVQSKTKTYFCKLICFTIVFTFSMLTHPAYALTKEEIDSLDNLVEEVLTSSGGLSPEEKVRKVAETLKPKAPKEWITTLEWYHEYFRGCRPGMSELTRDDNVRINSETADYMDEVGYAIDNGISIKSSTIEENRKAAERSAKKAKFDASELKMMIQLNEQSNEKSKLNAAQIKCEVAPKTKLIPETVELRVSKQLTVVLKNQDVPATQTEARALCVNEGMTLPTSEHCKQMKEGLKLTPGSKYHTSFWISDEADGSEKVCNLIENSVLLTEPETSESHKVICVKNH